MESQKFYVDSWIEFGDYGVSFESEGTREEVIKEITESFTKKASACKSKITVKISTSRDGKDAEEVFVIDKRLNTVLSKNQE